MSATPTASLKAQGLIWADIHRSVPAHRIRFELTTEPDQYRVSYSLPIEELGAFEHSLVPRITLTPREFQLWNDWLDGRYPGGRP
jgi:hypothetical protein